MTTIETPNSNDSPKLTSKFDTNITHTVGPHQICEKKVLLNNSQWNVTTTGFY